MIFLFFRPEALMVVPKESRVVGRSENLGTDEDVTSIKMVTMFDTIAPLDNTLEVFATVVMKMRADCLMCQNVLLSEI